MSALKVWTKHDTPIRPEMEEYLDRVRAVRDRLPVLPGVPEVPASMDGLNYERANDIERILLGVDRAVTQMEKSWFYSGEITSGGV